MQRQIAAVLLITLISAMIAMTASSLIPGIIGLVIAGGLCVLSVLSLVWITDQRFSLGFIRNLASALPQVAALFGGSFSDRKGTYL